jgi:hypothetical protein
MPLPAPRGISGVPVAAAHDTSRVSAAEVDGTTTPAGMIRKIPAPSA